MFPCVKCSFALYPVTEESVIWDEPLTTVSSFNFAFTSASVYPTLPVLVEIAVAWPPVIVVGWFCIES